MKMFPLSVRAVAPWLVAASTAALLVGCGPAEMDASDDADTTPVAEIDAPIIGGGPISVNVQRAMGLVIKNNGCSGALIHKDWVLTAMHCIGVWDNPASHSFKMLKTDLTFETRSAIALAQVGSSDLALVRLGGVSSTWPNVTHAMRPANAPGLVGQSITCYGVGATGYATPSGVTGGGSYRTLTRTVSDFVNGELVTNATATGTETGAPGDSGGNCFVSNQTVGVGSYVEADCADQTNDATCAQTITKIRNTHWRATMSYANYIDQSPNRAVTANFRPLGTFDGHIDFTLDNGWTNHSAGTNTVQVGNVQNSVRLRGGMSTGGSNPVPFTLPPGMRPSSDVYVPITLCDSAKGRLHVTPAGVVTVQEEGGNWPKAQCHTSLDGASFSISTVMTALSLSSGWTNSPYSTRPVAARNVNGIVRMQGAVANGNSTVLFTLPSDLRPASVVYVPVDLCNARKGRLLIDPGGIVNVMTFGGFADAQCFTSLEGVTYPINDSGFTPLPLQTGWSAAPSSMRTRAPMAKNVDGVIHLAGAILTNGNTDLAFILPPVMRPATAVYVPVDMCGVQKGRLQILLNGEVRVQAPPGFGLSGCFVSLEGATFGL